MRVSTRGRYALRAMIDVALHSNEGPVLRQGIAERQAISADYVAQLFSDLRRAGLVEGVRGPGGGYRLARDPAAITAGDVISAVEGPVAVVSCALPSDDPVCSRIDHCVTHSLWKRLSESITQVLDSVTLEEMREEARQLGEGHH
ncbi:MAG: Rrf2 family transcriptional regulator [Anaerolineales bacterium]|nr:MAG: Rrf2 family transcriptional regulator [Anaerolineales bacterium]